MSGEGSCRQKLTCSHTCSQLTHCSQPASNSCYLGPVFRLSSVAELFKDILTCLQEPIPSLADTVFLLSSSWRFMSCGSGTASNPHAEYNQQLLWLCGASRGVHTAQTTRLSRPVRQSRVLRCQLWKRIVMYQNPRNAGVFDCSREHSESFHDRRSDQARKSALDEFLAGTKKQPSCS